jgi:ATP-dependent DNA helicase RecQ
MELNEEMRVIFVGDDDQNIYGFRGADSIFMQRLIDEQQAKKYELVDNYRSKNNIVDYSNQWVQKLSQRLKTIPGYADQRENGNILVIQYKSSNMILPLTEALGRTDLEGSTCILAKTNEEAVQLNGLLTQRGFNARLIQTNEGFPLSNLYELRHFSDQLNHSPDSPIIWDDDWSAAIRDLSEKFQLSLKLDLALTAINHFAETNPVKKYKTDWKTFLIESKIEDFASIDNETIFVSTIHKAKGKEFNNVILLLNGFIPTGDEKKRELYVAITRAKTNLTIHYNGGYLSQIKTENFTYNYDNTVYNDVQQVALLLSHKDVQLGYFKYVQHRIANLQSGASLTIQDDGLGNKKEKVLQFSFRFREVLAGWMEKGFKPKKASVNFIVYWKDEEKDIEVKIILPEIFLTKENNI